MDLDIKEMADKQKKIQIYFNICTGQFFEGYITDCDTYMNLALRDAEKVHVRSGKREAVGEVVLYGDLINNIVPVEKPDDQQENPNKPN